MPLPSFAQDLLIDGSSLLSLESRGAVRVPNLFPIIPSTALEPPPHPRLRRSPGPLAQQPPRPFCRVSLSQSPVSPTFSPSPHSPRQPLTRLPGPQRSPISQALLAAPTPQPGCLGSPAPATLGGRSRAAQPHSRPDPRATTLALVTRCVARLTTAKLPLPMVRSIS